MGWWSCAILGGDTAYDAHGWVWDMVLEVAGSSYEEAIYDDDFQVFNHQQDILRDGLTEEVITEAISKLPEHPDSDIYAQVLALMLMESGAIFPEQARKELLSYAANDEWAKEDQQRALYVLDLCRRIENYEDGKAIEVPSVGLFDKMLGGVTDSDLESNFILTKDDQKSAQTLLSNY